MKTLLYHRFLGAGLIVLVTFCTWSRSARLPDKEFENEMGVYERADWNRQRLCDPKTGSIPPHAFDNDRMFLKVFQRQSRVATQSPQIQSSPLGFRPIGPSNVGGRTRAFGIDYSNPRVMLAGGVTGGLWRSIDEGETWTRVTNGDAILNVSCLAQHPKHPEIWYAGTGEVLSTTERRTSNALRTICTGSGVYKSVDHGVTWNRISPTFDDQANSLSSDFQGVWNMIPGDSLVTNELVVACYGSTYMYTNGSFVRIAGDTANKSFCTEIAVAKQNNTRILFTAYGATDAGTTPSTFGIYRSDGVSTQKITPKDFPSLARRIRMAVAPSNPNIVYVYVQVPAPQQSRYTSFGSQLFLWKYTDDGKGTGTWENRRAWLDSTNINTLAGYAMTLKVHPTNDSMVFIGGTDLFRSNSGFSNAVDAFHLGGYPYIVSPGRLHPDLHSLTFSATAPYTLYVTGDGGLSYYNSPTSMDDPYWRTLNNGYNVTQCYAVAQDHFERSDSLVAVSLQDNSNYVTESPSRGLGWSFCGGGDGTCAQIMPNANLIFAASQYSSVYAFTYRPNGRAEYTTFEAPPSLDTLNASFVTLFTLVERVGNHDTILVLPIANHLFYFPKLSSAYEMVSSVRSMWKEFTSVALTVPFGKKITALAQSKVDDATLFLGCSDGSVFKTTLTGTAGITIPLGTIPSAGFVSSMDCDENGNLLVSCSNYNTRSVFITPENIVQWKDISDDLELNIGLQKWGPSVRCVRFAFDSATSKNYILAGTSVGLFSREIGSSGNLSPWKQEAMNTVGSVVIENIDVRQSDGRILLGTHGAGVYESIRTDDTNGVDSSYYTYFSLEQNYPNPAKDYCFIKYHLPKSGHIQLQLFDALGKRVAVLIDQDMNAGPHIYELDKTIIGTLSESVYYYKLTQNGQSETRVLSIVR